MSLCRTLIKPDGERYHTALCFPAAQHYRDALIMTGSEAYAAAIVELIRALHLRRALGRE